MINEQCGIHFLSLFILIIVRSALCVTSNVNQLSHHSPPSCSLEQASKALKKKSSLCCAFMFHDCITSLGMKYLLWHVPVMLVSLINRCNSLLLPWKSAGKCDQSGGVYFEGCSKVGQVLKHYVVQHCVKYLSKVSKQYSHKKAFYCSTVKCIKSCFVVFCFLLSPLPVMK